MSFIVDSNFHGNVYVQTSDNETAYGDGSLKIDGTLFIDTINTATTNSLNVNIPINLQNTSIPDTPNDGTLLYFNNYNLCTKNNSGKLTQITGNNYYYEDPSEIDTTGTSWAPRYSVTINNLPASTYTCLFSFEWDTSMVGAFDAKLLVDAAVVDTFSIDASFFGVYTKIASFKNINLTNGSHTFLFQLSSQNNNIVIKTQNIRIAVNQFL